MKCSEKRWILREPRLTALVIKISKFLFELIANSDAPNTFFQLLVKRIRFWKVFRQLSLSLVVVNCIETAQHFCSIFINWVPLDNRSGCCSFKGLGFLRYKMRLWNDLLRWSLNLNRNASANFMTIPNRFHWLKISKFLHPIKKNIK